MTDTRQISKQQLDEWIESPVTTELKKLLENELLNIRADKADCYHPFEPQKTQEYLANFGGKEEMLRLLILCLDGDWDVIEEEAEHESEWDQP